MHLVNNNNQESQLALENEIIRRAKLKASTILETHIYRPDELTEDNPCVKENLEYGIRII